ncbi:ADP-ribosylation factor-like protein 6-interacting protein 4 [Zootermopsis nevadensis]|uniref:ADP-ribosylation factor-like protein 6-interacting protein 4 n=1 Tax=Zootermopsis nevadensis TaxID=136037 RepID=A0A067QJQ7_ZOONE|nr:ADP-ribosylation factor-like protein 6-interacting protein 4 [Zootermopsis nevadensis]XP_021938206.1 ADP-ribosylation factor-like protein 6-interacting protein 4 [Zootermopsis nevadensis]KDR09238.1 ADP-ribosylation factor-like protein 6-interacting protein 4 [Zootermopsis nevadensis]
MADKKRSHGSSLESQSLSPDRTRICKISEASSEQNELSKKLRLKENSRSSNLPKEKEKKKKLKKLEKKKRMKEKKLKKKHKKEKRRLKKAAAAAMTSTENAKDVKHKVFRDKEPEEPSDQLLMDRAKAMAPMTKEEWEKRQSVIRKVYDEETGRHRLIKGDGEILEEIVSRDRHREINRQATQGDGAFFQSTIAAKLKK